jgi:hypothetical protein
MKISSTLLCLVLCSLAHLGFSLLHHEDRCFDFSSWSALVFEPERAKCCDTVLQEYCHNKQEYVCMEVTEMKCDIVAWADCKTDFEWIQGKKCHVIHKDFPSRSCVEETHVTKHLKKVPDCDDIEKEVCEEVWKTLPNGKRISVQENCKTLEWKMENCRLVEKEVPFNSIKQNCDTTTNIKWADFVQTNQKLQAFKQTCEVKKSFDCRPQKFNKCATADYTVCELKPYDKCHDVNTFVPKQEEQHQKRCLN